MTPPAPRSIKDLFGQILDARERGRHEHASRLLEHADPEIREAVKELLEAHERAAGHLLDDTPQSDQPAPDDAPAPTIPDYEIGEEIGRGGFGIVYRARQRTPIDRPVAVKVLRRELVSDQAIARFRAESDLLARMNHDAIARVYDAGLTDQGQPFVAMQLIDAKPLHHACAELGLDTRQRVELMARVCDAIQHAHQRAIIHRDLKPANILVERDDDELQPRIIDFGIAKLLEHDPDSTNTHASVRLGTPRYMSPEQREGRNTGDTRVDVYALGAILCELLAGDVPSAGANRDTDSARTRPSRIAGEHTQRRGTHPRTLRGDLDRIILKACADDPEQRYPSAQALGDDLRRYLEGRPVSASPPGVVYLARKFVRRHRASVSLAAVLGVALCAALAVAAIKWREANTQRDRALASTQRVALIGDLLLELLLLSGDHDARGAPPGLTRQAMQDIADRARAGLEDDPEHMLPMLVGIGQFQSQSGYAKAGTETLRQALDFAIEHYGVPSEEVIDLRVRLHDSLWGHGLPGAREQIELADKEAAALYDEEDPRRLRVRQRADSSIGNLTRIIDLYEDMDAVDPADRYHALFALTMAQRFSQHPADQVETSRRLYEIALAHFPKEHTATIEAMALYGDALAAYAPSEEAARILKEAYDMAVPKYGYDHYNSEAIRRALARVYRNLGQPELGIPYALTDLESVERRHGPESIQYANALYELGCLYQSASRFEPAGEVLEHALRLRKEQWPGGHAQIITAQLSLAQVLVMLDEHDRALRLIDEIDEHIRDRRNAQNFVAANAVRIAVCLARGDEAGADERRQATRQHLAALGLTPEQIEQALSD